MRRFLFALALCAVPGCFLNINSEEDDAPPIANPCSVPAEPPLTLQTGPYGSGVEKFAIASAYPSFRSDYPKSLIVGSNSARIEYVHEGKAIVENWTLGPLTQPLEGQCNRVGHERGTLTIVGVTIDGVAGDLSFYEGWTVTLIAGATVHYRHAGGGELSTEYRHGFAPIFTTPCEFNRPDDGTACNEKAICAYDKEGEHCTARCASGKWQSFACTP